jgi:hypothetical protein
MRLVTAAIKGAVEVRTGVWRVGSRLYVKAACSVCGGECLVVKHLADRGAPAICSQVCNGARKSAAHTGNTFISRGYVIVHSPDHPMANKAGKLFEHRLVVSQHLGRLLAAHEVVHHKDGNRSNNAIENLELLAGHKEHSAKHWEEGELCKLHRQGLLRCSACREIKPLAAFDVGSTMRYGRKNQCKECRAEAHRKAHPDARPHDEIMHGRHHDRWLASTHYALFTEGKKLCRKCEVVKGVAAFSPYKSNKDGLMSYCKDCRNAAAQQVKRARRPKVSECPAT